ncbi:MAG TPA: sugar O-acetyltransferase [Candidatus Dorea gallistercoris]|uniref:Acetyltransferase n=1 Tax=Candidatus Dorea gallistercoris TaxID=2838542 RepID=A0A9D1RBF5_9FIRM|nr:sugar O-acetyltransferase [Candidatus Dorea gallistercoris]
MTDKELMLKGELYDPVGDPQLKEDFMRARRLTRIFNSLTEEEMERRIEVIKELFGGTGEHVHVEQTFHCDYGSHIYVGEYFYANYDCTIIDVCEVRIGDNVMLAPKVGIYTAGHPLDAGVRNDGLEFGAPVTIGDNVWIGGSAVINPGVTIGDNVVIGSGAVVTKDIPDNVIAVGNPCRVLREITQEDKIYWEKKKAEYERLMGPR